jgi:hypothetical protein
MKPTLMLLTAVFLAPLAALHAAEPFPTPAALWKDYDPDHGDGTASSTGTLTSAPMCSVRRSVFTADTA